VTLAASTEPLDLDHNGLFEWLAVRFRLPVAKKGDYVLFGSVSVPTDKGRKGGSIYPHGWDMNRSSVPFVEVHCDSVSCPAELWLSGENLTRANVDSVVTVRVYCSESGRPLADYSAFRIAIKRNDWRMFERGY